MSRAFRTDQPDETAIENVFYKLPVPSIFLTPKSTIPNIFKISQQPEAKSSQNQTHSIFGGAAASSFFFAKQPISPAPEPAHLPFSKSAVKPVGQIFTNSTKVAFSFTEQIEESRPTVIQFSFSAQQAKETGRKRKEQEELEEEIRLKEKAKQE